MAAQPILLSGHRWRVGNGLSINILKDRWIPNYPSNSILHQVHEDVEGMRVVDLINLDLHIWRTEEIMAMFHKEEAGAICQIPLSRRDVNDTIIWLHNSKGKFSVKSVYHVARNLGDRTGTSGSYAEWKVWATIWKLKLPNKIKIIGWWAYHEILPTARNLFRRRVVQENKCQLCMREEESTVHALWDCVAVQDIWYGSIRKLQKNRHEQQDMKQLMVDLLE